LPQNVAFAKTPHFIAEKKPMAKALWEWLLATIWRLERRSQRVQSLMPADVPLWFNSFKKPRKTRSRLLTWI